MRNSAVPCEQRTGIHDTGLWYAAQGAPVLAQLPAQTVTNNGDMVVVQLKWVIPSWLSHVITIQPISDKSMAMPPMMRAHTGHGECNGVVRMECTPKPDVLINLRPT